MNRGMMMQAAGMERGLFGGGWERLIVLAVILIIVAVVLWFRHKKKKTEGDSALKLLKEKFVKGEISEEEYLSRKKVLTKK